MTWDESGSAYIAEGPRMRSTHAGIRAAEGGGHVFLHGCVCISVRVQEGRDCRYEVSVVTSWGRLKAKRKKIARSF